MNFLTDLKFSIYINLTLTLGFSASLYAVGNDVYLHEKGAFEDNYIKILDVSRPLSESSLYVLSFPKDTAYGIGSFVKTFRQQQSATGLKQIPTGLLKIVKAESSSALAEIAENGTNFSRSYYPRYPQIMVGDLGEITFPEIQKTVVVTPIIEIEYRDLFIDPLEAPHTFELSEEGKLKIKETLALFADKNIKEIFIEAYTDDQGPAHMNQVESLQRALTIKHFATSELKINERLLTALGFGETSQIDDNYVPGYREKNRRIIIKTLPRQDETVIVTSSRLDSSPSQGSGSE
ncbi:MAG: OmpA family protein [Oligoflexales bacterium]|nr:OmpA family protein [Oligoflexales bacterium]